GQKQRKNVGFGCLSLGWLLFFPNAPYIFTDLIHLTTRYYRNFWVDLMVILPCALTGLVLGFLSLYLMQAIVNRVAGRAVGWLFTAGMAALSGVGVYLGRFYRFNSWDVLVRPGELYSGIGQWVAAPVEPSASFVFPALFGAFFFTAYVLLYGLTHLRPPALQPSEPGT
ncbi:MAG TPA: DUF1361 domain-containing protein, partial [Verrucomicrobiae bacterium]|nr:DUF1361 domain-containing protein [Verrucomicrobiae bacterium]